MLIPKDCTAKLSYLSKLVRLGLGLGLGLVLCLPACGIKGDLTLSDAQSAPTKQPPAEQPQESSDSDNEPKGLEE